MENTASNCKNIIYSEDYIDIILDYRIVGNCEDDTCYAGCVQVVSNNYIIAYTAVPTFDYLLSRVGYRSVPKCYGLLDTQALEETGVLKLRRQPFINLYGQNVLYGMLDCGIDYRSDVFVWQDGTTKIVEAWNQEDQSGPPPSGLAYGTRYTAEDINEALRGNAEYSYIDNLIDENGHGTSMAAVAVGNANPEEDFSGIAPLAEIVVVKLKQAKKFFRDYFEIKDSAVAFMESDVMLGVRYLTDVAKRLRRPLVICLGIGTNQGDHNGTGSFAEYLNSIASLSGIYVCTAAGNETGLQHHFRGNTLTKGTSQDVEILVKQEGTSRANKGFTTELWADAASFFSVRIKPPIGEFSGIVDARSSQVRQFDFRLSASRAEVFSEIVEKSTGDQLVHIRIIDPAPGIWTIRVIQDSDSPGRYDMWLPMQDFLSTDISFIEADPDITICEPGNTQNIITFGASSVDGSRIYVNSSRGYTRNGRIKPDLTAPGEEIFTVVPGPDGRTRYEFRTGTSLASAIGGGILALFAEWSNPQIPTNSVAAKQYLVRGADTEGLNIPNRSWGWGRVDIYNTFVEISE